MRLRARVRGGRIGAARGGHDGLAARRQARPWSPPERPASAAPNLPSDAGRLVSGQAIGVDAGTYFIR